MPTFNRQKEATIFIANHPIATRIAPEVIKLRLQGPLSLVCDATFSPIARLAFVDPIGINSPKKSSRTEDLSERKRIEILQKFGKIFHLYDRALRGDEAISKIEKTIESGRNLLIFPSGMTNPKADWQPGIGAVGLKFLDSPAVPAFVHIPQSYREPTLVTRFGSFREIIGDNEPPCNSWRMAQMLQSRYHQTYPQSLPEEQSDNHVQTLQHKTVINL